MEMNRRKFLKVGALFMAAPAVIRVAKLMPIKMDIPTLWGDMIHDDTKALQAFFAGERIKKAPGDFIAEHGSDGVTRLIGGTFRFSTPDLNFLRVGPPGRLFFIADNHFHNSHAHMLSTSAPPTEHTFIFNEVDFSYDERQSWCNGNLQF